MYEMVNIIPNNVWNYCLLRTFLDISKQTPTHKLYKNDFVTKILNLKKKF